ncbi:phage minor head protein [Cardiobacterium hominis]|uniref:phage head morphogenesis protein n=1 Tax=Cardiobacterium hominis TaxID=2718 RepID=UPI0028EAC341|nr:phage minor head protein [Cardiobacterium hominis]
MSLAHTQLPFAEQINYYRQKLDLPTESYADIYGAEHDHAFVVAGANRLDMVADFRKAVDKAIADGTTLEEFRRDFDDIVAKYGWQYHGGRDWRSRIIYDTNLHASYQAGRYEQQQEMKHLRPFWEYRHRDGQKHPRPEHEAWNGLVLHCDDPWWQTHYPVNAYGCKCTVFAHSKRSLERRGLKVGEAPAVEWQQQLIGKNSNKPRVVSVPKGIDPGFDRIPGKNAGREGLQRLFDKASAVPPKMATHAMQQVLDDPRTRTLLTQEITQMVDTVASEMVARGVSKSIGVIAPDILADLAARKLMPATAVITLRDKDILHILRTSKAGMHLPINFLHHIADHLQAPQAVLLDTTQSEPALLYVFDLGGNKGKVVLKLGYESRVKDAETGAKQNVLLNILRSGGTFVWDAKAQQGLAHYTLIKGKL